MAVLTPLGLLAPGGAFGEDPPSDLDLRRYHLGAVPDGLARYAGFWHHALFDGYGFGGDAHPVLGYLVSAVIGTAVIAAAVGGGWFVVGRWRRRADAAVGLHRP
jgi:cobalt/nickel transport system permease protein